MKYFICLCLAVTLQPFISAAQLKLSDIYPRLKKTSEPSYTVVCGEGNCREGNGVQLILEPFGSGIGQGKEWKTYNIHILKGAFTDDGHLFNGKKYSMKFRYVRKSGTKGKYEPDNDMSLDGKDNKLDEYLQYEGGLSLSEIKGRAVMKKQGNGVDYAKSQNKYGNIKSYRGLYENDTIQHAVILFQNSNLVAFEGMVHSAGEEFIYGDLLFKDNSLYRGGFFNKKFNGPGRLSNPDGTFAEGIWDDGVLISQEKLSLISPAAEAYQKLATTPFLLRLGNSTYSGKFSGPVKNNLPEGTGVFFTNNHTIYFGEFSKGIPQGKGFAYISDARKRSDGSIAYYYFYHYAGRFNNGWLEDGIIKEGSSTNPVYFTSYTGNFLNHKLQGCGISKNADSYGYTTTKAYFVDGKPKGWHKVNNDIRYAGTLKTPVSSYPDWLSFANANYSPETNDCGLISLSDLGLYYSSAISKQQNDREAALQKQQQEAAITKNKEILCTKNKQLVGSRFEAYNRGGVYEILSYDCDKARFTAFYFPPEKDLKSQYWAYYNNTPVELVSVSGNTDFSNYSLYRKTGNHSHMNAVICSACKGTGKVNTGRYSEQDPNVAVIGNTLYYNQNAVLITNYTVCKVCKGQKVK